jgi:altronate dehydratase small subunit
MEQSAGPTPRAVIIDPADNVATALANLDGGERLSLSLADRTALVELKGRIPFGHKFSLGIIRRGSPVIKYGETIGIASTTIRPGVHVHVHNVSSARGRGDLASEDK